ncbi:hypothetical protein OB920_13255 [Halobacteria archaeon HArc-gm2]|nr:hypothetical protein [Halobacteria archaeon HArc-gm2]
MMSNDSEIYDQWRRGEITREEAETRVEDNWEVVSQIGSVRWARSGEDSERVSDELDGLFSSDEGGDNE